MPNAHLEQAGVGARGNKAEKGNLPEVIPGSQWTKVHKWEATGGAWDLQGICHCWMAPFQVGCGPVTLAPRDPDFLKPFFTPRRDLGFFQPSLTKASRWQQALKPNTPVLS